MPRTGFGAALLAVLLASGCSLFGKGDGKPPTVEVTVSAGDRLNPDESGSSLPTNVRIYLLKAPGKGELAEFSDLYQRDKEVLGDELVLVDQLVLSPGEVAVRKLSPEKGAGAVLVMGVFRKPVGQTWRSVVVLPQGKDAKLSFQAADYRIERR